MILIIAEKPSLARNIAEAIGHLKRQDGFLAGEGYLISWAFGHLFSLCDIEAYSGALDSEAEKPHWTMENLPCFPKEFRFELRREGRGREVDPGVRKQFETLRTLCNRPDVEAIVNAGDADREGEIIVRLCIRYALEDPNKKLLRLWLPDQTPETVRKALSEMKEEREYDLLAAEGYARTYIDWLYGVNLTRYATLRTGTLLRVGRVIIPIVKAIYDRDMAIRNFVPGTYYALLSKEKTKGETVELLSKKKFGQEQYAEAVELAAKYNAGGAYVLSVKKKKDTLSPGKLYSLSKLQNVLGKKYKMSLKESLEIIQRLYERGFLTYPRTNSEYLATAEKDKIKKILNSIAKMGYRVAFRDDKTIFDDSKIESHSALTPTYKIPAREALSKEESLVYSTVFRRFVAVFSAEKCIVSRTEITVRVAPDTDYTEDFVLKGTVMLEPGWTKYDDYHQKDKILPKLEKGEKVEIDFRPTEKETSPPRHYTIETLNHYLKNPFREEMAAAKKGESPMGEHSEEGGEENDEADYKAMFEGLELGTEATRTGIIDHARSSGYIDLKKDVYSILPGGEFLIESLAEMKIAMDKYKTSQLGRALKQVYQGKLSIEESVALAEEEIGEIFARTKQGEDVGPEEDTDTGFAFAGIGKCPICGSEVRKIKSIYGCSGYQNGCKFAVRTHICGRAISVSNMRLLLETGRTAVIRGFVSKKSGKNFDASLVLSDGNAVFEFPERRERREEPIEEAPVPVCPICRKPIVRGKTAYGCLGYKEGCTFRVPFSLFGCEIGDGDLWKLLSSGSLQKTSEEGSEKNIVLTETGELKLLLPDVLLQEK